jgi:hypothetical protein
LARHAPVVDLIRQSPAWALGGNPTLVSLLVKKIELKESNVHSPPASGFGAHDEVPPAGRALSMK